MKIIVIINGAYTQRYPSPIPIGVRNKAVWQFVSESLTAGIPTVLLAVVQSQGASPGKAGFKLALNAVGAKCGTIGGGIMEARWIERVGQMFRDNALAQSVHHLHHSTETIHEPSGLICSGSQVLLVYPIRDAMTSAVGDIVAAFDRHDKVGLRITPAHMTTGTANQFHSEPMFQFSSQDDWVYEEQTGVLDTVFVVGSGHVGLAVCKVLSTLDFHVVVIDDRHDVDTFAANTFAHRRLSMPYGNLGELVSGTEREYMVIVTAAYRSDEAALRAIAGKNVRYVGLMGSEAKTAQIFKDLRQEGIRESFLARVRSPIGVPIYSHTPEEIAISIAAEIIKERNDPF